MEVTVDRVGVHLEVVAEAVRGMVLLVVELVELVAQHQEPKVNRTILPMDAEVVERMMANGPMIMQMWELQVPI
jgi:hypothetical protein